MLFLAVLLNVKTIKWVMIKQLVFTKLLTIYQRK
jgi:hypothetical protein